MNRILIALILILNITSSAFATPSVKAKKAKTSRKPSQTEIYSCVATAWPVQDYPVDRAATVHLLGSNPRNHVYQYFLHEITTLDPKNSARLAFGRNIAYFLSNTEPSEFYQGFLAVVISAAELNTEQAHALDLSEVCELMAKVQQSELTPRE